MGKGDIKKLVLNYLVEEEIFPEEDLERVALSVEQTLELSRQVQDRHDISRIV